jgi:hypothetical protein
MRGDVDLQTCRVKHELRFGSSVFAGMPSSGAYASLPIRSIESTRVTRLSSPSAVRLGMPPWPTRCASVPSQNASGHRSNPDAVGLSWCRDGSGEASLVRCSAQSSGSRVSAISLAAVSSGGCWPFRMAVTMSGARKVSRMGRGQALALRIDRKAGQEARLSSAGSGLSVHPIGAEDLLHLLPQPLIDEGRGLAGISTALVHERAAGRGGSAAADRARQMMVWTATGGMAL